MLLATNKPSRKVSVKVPITASTTVGAEKKRIAGLDLVRFFAALCVIGTHSGTWQHHVSGYFRMPFYAAMVTFLVTGGVIRGKHRQFLEFTRSRGLRLLVPFAVWMVPFGLPAILAYQVQGLTLSDFFSGNAAGHLWFLPFAFLSSLAAWLIVRTWVGLNPTTTRLPLALAMALMGILAIYFCPLGHDGDQLWQYWFRPLISPMFLGISLALLFETPRVKNLLRESWRINLILGAWFVLLSRFPEPGNLNTFGTLGGVFLLITGLTVQIPAFPGMQAILKYLGQLSYGMYLIHVGFIRILQYFWQEFDHIHTWQRFVIVACLSMIWAALLQRVGWGRFIIGMESEKAAKQQRFSRRANPSRNSLRDDQHRGSDTRSRSSRQAVTAD